MSRAIGLACAFLPAVVLVAWGLALRLREADPCAEFCRGR